MTTQQKPRRSSRRHNDTDPARTGALIRQLRLNKEITQEDLATAAGYRHHHSISRIESGERAIPDGKLIKVARFLGVDADKIRKPAVRIAK